MSVGNLGFFEYITPSEWNEIYNMAGQSFSEEYQKYSSNPLKQLKTMCKAYQVILENEIKLNKNGVSVNKRNQSNIDKYTSLQTYGVKLLYSIRTFLLDEEITFIMGETSPTGQLVEKVIPQRELLNSLKTDIKKNSMVVQESLLQIKAQQATSSIAGMWQDLLTWGAIEEGVKPDIDDDSPDKIIPRTPTKRNKDTTRPIYRHLSKDTNVYIGYAGNNYYHYYFPQGSSDYFFYNRGWLYEWYSAKIRAQNSMDNYASQLYAYMKYFDHPLMLIVTNQDNIQGLQGGDFADATGTQIQAKYGNKKIISIQNIMTAISTILVELDQFESGIRNYRAFAEEISKVFSTDETRINQSYSDLIDKIIDKLGLMNIHD